MTYLVVVGGPCKCCLFCTVSDDSHTSMCSHGIFELEKHAWLHVDVIRWWFIGWGCTFRCSNWHFKSIYDLHDEYKPGLTKQNIPLPSWQSWTWDCFVKSGPRQTFFSALAGLKHLSVISTKLCTIARSVHNVELLVDIVSDWNSRKTVQDKIFN